MIVRDHPCNLETAILRDVLDHPQDAVPLLVYADWLQDQPDLASQTRGEYLRVTWQLEQRTRLPSRDVYELRWRANHLWWNHGESWLGSLYQACDHFLYERGRLCVEISDEVFRAVPSEEIVTAPAWNWLTDLVVRKGSLDLLLRLGELPIPGMLISLEMGHRSLEEGELEYLLEQGFWEGIRELALTHNDLGSSGATALASWPGLQGVRDLDLRYCRIGPPGLLDLAESPYLEGIESLRLGYNANDDEAMDRLWDRFERRLSVN